MKLFYILVIFPVFVWGTGKDISCAVPSKIISFVSPIFKEKIVYTHRSVIIKPYQDNLAALNAVRSNKMDFAVIRADILAHIQTIKPFSSEYITISMLPFVSRLYLVQNADEYDIDLDTLQEKNVSIDRLGEENAYLLKDILKQYDLKYSVHYKSIPYKETLQQLTDGELDAYFGFLPISYETGTYHFQSIFSNRTTAYFEDQGIYKVDYDGIHVPYILVASMKASDEKIENMIYRLTERKLFAPLTDIRFGEINRYVLQHLEQIRMSMEALQKKDSRLTAKKSQESSKMRPACLQYHYGFLDLLRQKPPLKKKLKFIKHIHPEKYKQAWILIKEIDSILIKIDKNREECELHFLQKEKEKFRSVSKKIKILAK